MQTAVNFGLINKTYPGSGAGNATQWQRFTQVVDSLNADADLDTVYKVLFMGRHGEGFHNAAESYYGTPAWNVRQSDGLYLPISIPDRVLVLLVRTGRQQHHRLGRCRSHRERPQAGSNRECLLAEANLDPTRPLPAVILHLSSDSLPAHCQHHFL